MKLFDIGVYSGYASYVLYVGLGVGLIFGAFILMNSINLKKRMQSFQKLGETYGLSYEQSFDTSLLPEFDIFRNGDKKEAKNVLTGSYNMISWKIFDYIITEHKGEQKKKHENTVFMVQLYNVNLPTFKLSPKRFMQRMGFGGKEIEIDSKIFADRFVLQGMDEIRIRDIFRPDVVMFLQGLGRQPTIEGYGNIIVYYEKDRINELQEAFDIVYGFARFFTREYKIMDRL